MKSNLPPGVTTGMLPGNTSEDAAWERFCEMACDEYAKPEHMLTIEEAHMALHAGIAAVKATRDTLNTLIREIRKDERLSYDMERNAVQEQFERESS